MTEFYMGNVVIIETLLIIYLGICYKNALSSFRSVWKVTYRAKSTLSIIHNISYCFQTKDARDTKFNCAMDYIIIATTYVHYKSRVKNVSYRALNTGHSIPVRCNLFLTICISFFLPDTLIFVLK